MYAQNYYGYNNSYYGYDQNGGYPYGYPPYPSQNGVPDYMNSQYSPFGVGMTPQQPYVGNNYIPNNQDFQYVPGRVAPVEVTYDNGVTQQLPPPTMNIPGGTTVNDGGFNPVSGMNTQQVSSQGYGFNPFYGPNGRVYNPSYMMNNVPFSPICYNYPFQNEFNYTLNDLMYEDKVEYDIRPDLENILLTDEEKRSANAYRNVQYDYYGRPIGQSAYEDNIRRQEEFEQQRLNQQVVFTNISRIAHAYFGEQIDEQATMEKYDPVPKQVKPKTYLEMTPEERKQYDADKRVYDTQRLIAEATSFENVLAMREQQRAYFYTKIKESHDRMLGVQPGEHYDLNTFLNNGYKLVVSAMVDRSKLSRKDGARKYSSNQYRQIMQNTTGMNVPMSSKDDDYIPIEQKLKEIYEKNKGSSLMMALPGGGFAFGIAPPGEDQEEYRQRLYKESLDRKAQRDLLRQQGGG